MFKLASHDFVAMGLYVKIIVIHFMFGDNPQYYVYNCSYILLFGLLTDIHIDYLGISCEMCVYFSNRIIVITYQLIYIFSFKNIT